MWIDFGPIGELEVDILKSGRKPYNSTWTAEREQILLVMWKRNAKVKVIAERLKLSDGAIRAKLARMGMMYVKKTGPTPPLLNWRRTFEAQQIFLI